MNRYVCVYLAIYISAFENLTKTMSRILTPSLMIVYSKLMLMWYTVSLLPARYFRLLICFTL